MNARILPAHQIDRRVKLGKAYLSSKLAEVTVTKPVYRWAFRVVGQSWVVVQVMENVALLEQRGKPIQERSPLLAVVT